MKNVAWFQALFNFQRTLCKKVSEDACIPICSNLDSFSITYISNLLHKSHFPIDVVLKSLQTQKTLELVFMLQFL